MLTLGTAPSANYHAACGADNARATKPKVTLNDGLSLGPSAEQGSVGSATHRGPSNIPMLALLLALVYDVLLPLGLAGSQTQGQEPSPGKQSTLQLFLVPPRPLAPACGIWDLSYKSQQKKARWFLAQPFWGKKKKTNKKNHQKKPKKTNKQTNNHHTHTKTNQTNKKKPKKTNQESPSLQDTEAVSACTSFFPASANSSWQLSGHQHDKQGCRPSQCKEWETLSLPCFLHRPTQAMAVSHNFLTFLVPGWAHSATSLSDNTLLWTAL